MKNIENKLKLLEFQRDWCKTILEFVYNNVERIDNFKKQILIVDETFTIKDYRGMDYLFKDITQYKDDLTESQRDKLDKELVEKFSFGIDNYEAKRFKNVLKIIMNGKINNVKEYNEIIDRIEIIHNNPSSLEELNKLNQLIIDFEKSFNIRDDG